MTTPNSVVGQDLKKLEHDWAAAVHRGDVSVLEQIIADTFVGTTPDGRVESKADYLKQYLSGDLKISSVEASELRVSVYGSCAVVTGRSSIEGVRGLRSVNVRRRWTDVFVREGNNWRCVAAQACEI